MTILTIPKRSTDKIYDPHVELVKAIQWAVIEVVLMIGCVVGVLHATGVF